MMIPATDSQRPLLRADEESRRAFYSRCLNSGLALFGLHSTSGRSSRGRK